MAMAMATATAINNINCSNGLIEGRNMISPKTLPTILIIIGVLAAIPYAMAGDYRRCIYWLAAGVLTLVVTW
jgi:hypothetical protein